MKPSAWVSKKCFDAEQIEWSAYKKEYKIFIFFPAIAQPPALSFLMLVFLFYKAFFSLTKKKIFSFALNLGRKKWVVDRFKAPSWSNDGKATYGFALENFEGIESRSSDCR